MIFVDESFECEFLFNWFMTIQHIILYNKSTLYINKIKQRWDNQLNTRQT